MSFYKQISEYYDYIFPTGRAQLEFIENSAGAPPKSILDVACGSGGYSIELARLGYDVTAVDFDSKMVELAVKKALKEGLKLNALQCDMRELQKTIEGRQSADGGFLQGKSLFFDCLFCIGNSIVHLGSLDEITRVLKQMNRLLEDEGALVLQIINYDRIVKYGVSELPLITNDEVGLEFVRKYEYDSQRKIVHFNTLLTIDNNNQHERYENSIELLALMSSELNGALKDAGFTRIEFYGDFNGAPYDDKSYMLVVRAKK